jgi:ubiquinone/menaquinone biosynthesis C-methylase UbiE
MTKPIAKDPAHNDNVQAQFDPRAQAYLQSAVHAAGPDLLRARGIVDAAASTKETRLLDVGCGAGHLSFALAQAVKEAVALDASPNMLATVANAAAQRGLRNIATCRGSAEDLPFEDSTFDIVATRYSAHHWLNLPEGLREMRRVVKPGGHILVIDLQGDDNALVDTHLQAIELLRDLSHVRDRSPAEWTRLLCGAGFGETLHESWPTRLTFKTWVERMQTPAERIAAIRTLQQQCPSEVVAALAIEADGSFTPRTGLWWARADDRNAAGSSAPQ